MTIKTVVCYTSSSLGADADAVEHLRILAPYQGLGLRVIAGVEAEKTVVERVDEADLVIIQREFPEQFDVYQNIVTRARKAGKPVLFEIDDLLFNLPEDHPDRQTRFFVASLLPMLQAVEEADLVTASTPALANHLKSHNPNVVVLPNCFDEQLWQLRPPLLKPVGEVLTIGYMGGKTHQSDLALVTPVLLELLSRYPGRLRFHFWGLQPPAELMAHAEVEWSPSVTYAYKDFAAYFQSQSADIFVAPLTDTRFNRSKSALKFFEYSALGAVGIYSHLDTYDGIVFHGENGLLARSEAEWRDGLVRLIEDRELRFRMATNAQATIQKDWLLSKNLYRWQEALERLAKNPPTPSTGGEEIIPSINAQLYKSFTEKDAGILALKQEKIAFERELANLRSTVYRREKTIQELNLRLNEIFSSTAWKLIQVMWKVRLWLAPTGSRREEWGRKLFNLYRRPPSQVQVEKSSSAAEGSPAGQVQWGIMATQHTLYIAHLIARRLEDHGWSVTITTGDPKDFSLDHYVVICPQMFKALPPREKRVVFQLEQSVSPRWFTEAYFRILDESSVVLDYSLKNIEFLANNGFEYSHFYYLPIGAIENYSGKPAPEEKQFDVLFYGDWMSSPRRQKMLEALKQYFNVKIVTEIFGEDMRVIIRQAKVVINLHYYENALLEIPRIQECLSLGVPVVSEQAQDQNEYPELAGAVRFFELDSIPAMVETVKTALEDPISSEAVDQSVRRSAQRFEFMFDRFLVGVGLLPNRYLQTIRLPELAGEMVLSLPETIERRRSLEPICPERFVVFDGMRNLKAWIGSGMSYSALARKALEMGLPRLTVMEDDVILPSDFSEKMKIIHEYLDGHEGEWDIFAGVIASIHPWMKVLKVETFKAIQFATINKMTSTVCNIYSPKALEILKGWNPENLNVQNNTIDKYIEGQASLRVVVALPFLVGHREEVNSTIWGFQNTQYHDMILAAQQKLQEKVRAFEARHSANKE